ncbi:MAG: DUF397 domain-containing protein [Pseudonocardiales bacterium]|nr:DUF397 domain-containing protein [Pseudonocardiales bacterium]
MIYTLGAVAELVSPWRKSRYSNGGDNCVEVATWRGGIILRDSKDPGGPAITVDREQWHLFLVEFLARHTAAAVRSARGSGGIRSTLWTGSPRASR